MKPYLRAFPLILVAFLCVAELTWAQGKTQRPDDKSTRAADGAGGTMVKKPPVTSDDDIVKLTVRKHSAATENLVAKNATTEGAFSNAADPAKAIAEIAALRLEIKNKQRKLELLMKIFVTDEQPFLRNPSGQNGEDDAQMKRRYEQEELRQTAAEIGQLRARLDALVSAVEAKLAPASR